MDLQLILEMLQKYDVPTVILGLIFFIYIKKKLKHVDNAVNNRGKGGLTLSEEVSEIHRKTNINTTQSKNIEYIKQEIDFQKESYEIQFTKIGQEIRSLNKKIKKLTKTI
tara:strand:+ start:449 stop:778 length:330 start_codon:yes stop_codon:yes gene_type:complete